MLTTAVNLFPIKYGYCIMNVVYADIMGNTHFQTCQLNYFSLNVVLTLVFPFNITMYLQHTVQTKDVLKCIFSTWQIDLLKHVETSLLMEIIRLFLWVDIQDNIFCSIFLFLKTLALPLQYLGSRYRYFLKFVCKLGWRTTPWDINDILTCLQKSII